MDKKGKSLPGYLYILSHPALPSYFKLGNTVKHPQIRLKEHNSHRSKFLGQIVEHTGQEWRLIYYVPVTEARSAESYYYDVLPRFGNLELLNGSAIESVIADIKKSPYIDHAKLSEMVVSELQAYDVEELLRSLRLEWAKQGVAERGEVLLKDLKDKRRSKDKRYSIFD